MVPSATFACLLLLFVTLSSASRAVDKQLKGRARTKTTTRENYDYDKYLTNRIINGQETSIEDFPFQLSLEGGGRHICGGSILSEKWALTAAHCVYDLPIRWLSFRAGSSQRESGGTVHPVKYYISHDKYSTDLDYDVAVVAVKIPFKFSSTVMPVLLPYRRVLGGQSAVVSGWGYQQKQLLSKPKMLNAALVKTYWWEACSKTFPGQITPRMMCAGYLQRDICNGDSGGPLVLGSRQQVGIVSWGYECGSGKPGVYTNVSVVEQWIRHKADIEEPDVLIFQD